jgi:hypothetical protein
MNFSESIVDSLEAISSKVDEVTQKIETLETMLGDGGETDSAEENVTEEDSVEVEMGDPSGTDEIAEVSDTEVAEVPGEEVVTDEVDQAAIDALSEGETPEASEEVPQEVAQDAQEEEFSYLVVGRINRPWGNTVITSKEFSEKEHRKLIPTNFATRAQAQRALSSYNINGENFSIRYKSVKNLFNM